MSTIEELMSINSSSNVTSNRAPGGDLDKDAFLKLLLTQMQYQDPLNPMDNTQFVAQLAQFSSLEQMQNISKTTTESQAYSMIGNIVKGLHFNEATGYYEEYAGVVSSVATISGKIYLGIDGVQRPLESVTEISQDVNSIVIGDINNTLGNSQNIALIGKFVQAVLSESGKATEFIEGKVDYIKASGDGNTILVVNGKEVFVSEVISISNDNMIIGKEIGYYTKNEDNETKLVTGIAEKIVFKDEKPYLVIDGKEISIDKINYVAEALALVGKEIKYNSISGKVDAVAIKDKVPFLIVGDQQISYELFRK